MSQGFYNNFFHWTAKLGCYNNFCKWNRIPNSNVYDQFFLKKQHSIASCSLIEEALIPSTQTKAKNWAVLPPSWSTRSGVQLHEDIELHSSWPKSNGYLCHLRWTIKWQRSETDIEEQIFAFQLLSRLRFHCIMFRKVKALARWPAQRCRWLRLSPDGWGPPQPAPEGQSSPKGYGLLQNVLHY